MGPIYTSRVPAWLKSARRDEGGQAIAELALILPILLLILFGIIDFAKALNYWNDTTNLANIGARAAVVEVTAGNPSCSGTTQTSIAAYLQCEATIDSSQLSNISVCVLDQSQSLHGSSGSPIAQINSGDQLEIKVTYQYTWLGFISSKLGISTSTGISSAATMRMEGKPTAANTWFEGNNTSC